MVGIDVRIGRVMQNDRVAPEMFHLAVAGSFPALPGQFYMLRAWGLDPLLSRPMSVFDRSDEAISFLYQVRGRGTTLLSQLTPGDKMTLFGPLGNGWGREGKRIALVGGGCGIAPLYYTAKVFGDVDAYLGFRDRPFWVDAFEAVSSRVVVSSESGEGGVRGLITEAFRPDEYDACYACGPREMLNVLARKCRKAGVPLWVSLEERMACGIGACLGCAVRTSDGIRRVCKDGPVFRAKEVVWDG
jgi:dihydroorotate dehydrogenase electron transfer subunit